MQSGTLCDRGRNAGENNGEALKAPTMDVLPVGSGKGNAVNIDATRIALYTRTTPHRSRRLYDPASSELCRIGSSIVSKDAAIT